MDELQKKVAALHEEVDAIMQKMQIDALNKELSDIAQEQTDPVFWQDTKNANIRIERQRTLTQLTEPWMTLRQELKDMTELLRMNDQSILNDLQQQFQKAEKTASQLKKLAQYNGPYDQHHAIVSIYAGAGGTDAQDWASMLLRMYIRWAEQQKATVHILQESAGDEAGIKSVTLEIGGPLMYGRLKGEGGVHRLVRLSPFNADNLRQTSFAKVDVLPKIDTPDAIVIDDKDLKIDVYRAGGHGGQSVNTTDSAVRVTHIPTGIAVAIQNERSQLQNKETALTILRSKLAQLQLEQHKDTIAELKGQNEQAAWGNQIRNYVMHPYNLVKDTRTKYETSDVNGVLNGEIDDFIEAYTTLAL